MREIDAMTISKIGIPGIVLMENAAFRVVDESIGMLGAVSGKKAVVCAGKGNNGGDAFAAARHLYNKGARVKAYIVAGIKDITGDAAVNLNALLMSGAEIRELETGFSADALRNDLKSADIILDGIFGTGLKGKVEGPAAEVIALINESGRPVISIDIPSGLSGETGKILGCCVKARKTVTFGLPKIGLAVYPGCEYAGEVVVADIGIPRKVTEALDIRTNIIDADMVAKIIPSRRRESNKGDYGKVLIITGSTGMTGAGCLAACAALRSGAGLVYLGVPSSLSFIYEIALRESITIPLEDEGKGFLSAKSAKSILERMEGKTVVAAGPGLSVNDDIAEIMESIIKNAKMPLILDADALNAVSRDVSVLGHLKADAVVTPHPGEMARLAGMTVKEVQDDRIGAAKEFACKWNVITVLKGARTVIAVPDGTVYINPTGNAGMATAGAGDVLTGMIAGFAAQGIRLEDAVVAGVYLHGLAGDIAASEKGEHGLIAADLADRLPYAIKQSCTENAGRMSGGLQA